MIPELRTKKAAKLWMLEHVWAERCPVGHIMIPTDQELEWYHHKDSGGMSVNRQRALRSVYCDYCWMKVEHVALRETVRLTQEYLNIVVWGKHGS
jgi:hypothetical protein